MKPARFISVAAASLAIGAWGPWTLTGAAQQTPAQPGEHPATQPNIRPTTRATDCTTSGCHAKEIGYKFLHGPTAVSACDSCHIYSDIASHTFKLRAEGRDLCTFCHINRAGGEAPFSHKPYTDGECLKCHNPHGGEVRFNLRKPSVNELCLSCHEKVLAGHPNVHKAVTANNCTACHKPHTSDHAKLLVKDTRDLCLSCHQDVEHQVTTAVSFHEPLKPGKGDCLQCHTPHASDTTHELKAPPAELCGSCHKDVAQTAATATNPHAAVTQGEACLNCHTPHGSAHAKLMKSAPIETCLACHKEPPKAVEAKKDLNPARPVFADQNEGTPAQPAKPKEIAKPVPELADKSFNPHGPVAEGKCAACHDVHGGTRANLLKAKFSDDFYQSYSPDNFALCFTCHNQQLAASPTTTDQTNFRDGERNLHFVHVNKEQGRTCTACHTVHASRVPQQICDTVSYGNWQLPINYKPNETGGSCAPGCHRHKTYTRTAVKIPVKSLELPSSPAGAAPAAPGPAAPAAPTDK